MAHRTSPSTLATMTTRVALALAAICGLLIVSYAGFTQRAGVQGLQPAVSNLRPVALYVDPANGSLSHHSPTDYSLRHSGRPEVEAFLRYPDGEVRAIKIEARVDSTLRIKTKKSSLFFGMRIFNLLPPTSGGQLNTALAYKLAAAVGLVTPRHELVSLSVNGHYSGTHLLVEQLSESTLRHHRRMPGDLYSSELLAQDPHPAGVETHLFDDPGLWKKIAVNNHYPEASLAPLEHLSQVLSSDHFRDCDALTTLLPPETWGRFFAFEALSRTFHAQDSPRWRLYYDPARNFLEPVVWDPEGWHPRWIPEPKTTAQSEFVPNLLHEVLLSRQAYLLARRKALEHFLTDGSAKTFLQEVDQTIEASIQAARAAPKSVFAFRPFGARSVVTARHDLRQDIAKVFDDLESAILEMKQPDTVPDDDIGCPESTWHPEIWKGTRTIEGTRLVRGDLTLQPGTTLRLEAGASLIVEGRLVAVGTPERPIQFLPARDQQEPWGAVVLRGAGANGSVLEHCEIAEGSGLKNDLAEYSAMFSLHDVDNVSISHCHFRDNHNVDDMLRAVYSSLLLRDSTFENALSDAVDFDISQGTIERCIFEASGNDAVDLMTSEVLVADSRLAHSTDKGLSVGEDATVVAINNLFLGNTTGVESKDGSVAQIYNSTFRDNLLALKANPKNWRYDDGGSIFLRYSVVEGSGELARAQKRSGIHVGASRISAIAARSKRVFMRDGPLSLPLWAQSHRARIKPSEQGWSGK